MSLDNKENQLTLQEFFQLGRISYHLKNLPPIFSEFKLKKEEIAEIQSIEEAYTFCQDDEDVKKMLKEQYDKFQQEIEEKISKLKPQKCVTLEIRAGEGGAEGAIFALDLFNIYKLYMEMKKWKMEIIHISKNNLKGLKSIKVMIKGREVELLKYESGVHRVQRIPKTESKGRVHTSAASVVVIDIPERIDIKINPADLRIDRYRASGAGGQHVNTTDSAVRITHIPTGVVVQCQDQRSQRENHRRAMDNLKIKLYENEKLQQESQLSAVRRSAIKTNSRGDKIRTYNYPQNRMTDHRIRQNYSLTKILTGKLDEVLNNYKFHLKKLFFQELKAELKNIQ